MEYSSAEMTCVLKVNTQCEACKVKMMQILQNIYGVYTITMDGEEGTVKISGRVNPGTLLGVLEKYGQHAKLKYARFDGEAVERSHCYYGYASNGMEYPYPPLGCPQHQWYDTSLNFFPPPPPQPPPPPPPLAPFPAAPPLVPFRVAPPPPAPFCAPPPFSHVQRGLDPRQNENLVKEHKQCTIM